MKKNRKAYPATYSGTGEKVLNVLIVIALLILGIMVSVMVSALREELFPAFNARSQLYVLEDKDYGSFVVNYYFSFGNFTEGRSQEEKELRSTAEYIESALLSHAAQCCGDEELLQGQQERMEKARAGMGSFAAEADHVQQILAQYPQ